MTVKKYQKLIIRFCFLLILGLSFIVFAVPIVSSVNPNMNLLKENTSLKVQNGDLFISGTTIEDLSDVTYSNIYIFDQAQVTLTNVTVTGDIEVYGTATLLMQNNGSMNQLRLYEYATATLRAIKSIGNNVRGNGDSQLFIENCMFYNWVYLYFYDNTEVQARHSRWDGYSYFYDYSNGTFLNVTTNYLRYYDWSTGSVDNCTASSCVVDSYATISLLNSTLHSELNVQSHSTTTVTDTQCYTLHVRNSDDYGNAAQLIASNLHVQDLSYLEGNITVSFDLCHLDGSVSVFCYAWQTRAPRVTLVSTNATLTKEPSGSSDYNSTAEEITLFNSVLTIIFIKVTELQAYDSSFVHLHNSQLYRVILDSSSEIFGPSGEILDFRNPWSSIPADQTVSVDDVGVTISWYLYDETAPGTFIVYRNGNKIFSFAWTNGTEITIPVDTSKAGDWNYIITYTDSAGNQGTPISLWIYIEGEITSLPSEPETTDTELKTTGGRATPTISPGWTLPILLLTVVTWIAYRKQNNRK